MAAKLDRLVEMSDEEIFKYFKKKTKAELQELVKRLNTLKQVEFCGGLSRCFNCRNKDIFYRDQQYFSKSGVPPEPSKDSPVEDPSAKSSSPRDAKEELRRKQGEHFQKELERILSG